MLSTENLPPPSSSSDLSSTNQTLLLLHDHHHNPLPKFSIRDYVFTSRSKDLETNWPFSQKNLQRCLRHGVKDVLPPFQSLNTVRNQPRKIRCTVEDDENILDVCCDNVLVDLSDKAELKETKLAEARKDITTIPCRSEGENDFPSTIASISQSEMEESAPINRRSSSAIETDTSLEAASVQEKTAAPRIAVANKRGIRTFRPPSGKKCRLIVKVNNYSDRNSKEDSASNRSTISETMTSKFCPVCKTFSSSSNTTLNAHIDQCLSGESTTKNAEESKVTTRHRIKPKKTKMMVDIYVTAQHCTLEDLDRRNGSSWATTISSLPTNPDKKKPDDPMPAEVKRQRVSSVYPEPDDIEVGTVYVDASGTKVRILSKFDDKSSPRACKPVEHLRPIKPLKAGGKVSKFISGKKKKHHYCHHKDLKLPPESRNLVSPKAHSPEIREDEKRHKLEGSSKEESHQFKKPVSPCNPLALRSWACSKRTGVAKKLKHKDDHHQAVESKWNESRNFLVERKQQVCIPVEEICVQNYSGNPIYSTERNSSSENEFSDSEDSDKSDYSPRCTRVSSDSIERSHNRSNLRDFSLEGNYEPMFANTVVGTATSPSENYRNPLDASVQPSKGRSFSRSNSMKLPSSKKIVSSVGGRFSVTENDAAFVKKIPAVKKSQVQKRPLDIDRDVDSDSEDDQSHDFMYKSPGKQSRKGDDTEASPRRNVLRRTRSSISYLSWKEPVASKSSHLESEHSGDDEMREMDTSGTFGDEFVTKQVDGFGLPQRENQVLNDDIATESCALIGVGKTVARFCSPVDPTDPIIDNERYMFRVDEVDDSTVGHCAVEMDSEVGQGSYFTEVDPIPIPGPPGSFLPSPRDMGSDELQGNSSLTTSRVQSSHDQLDFVDGDASDSPISTTSTVSHSKGTYHDRKLSELLSSKGSQHVQEKIVSGVSSCAASDASVETDAAAMQQITDSLAGRLAFDRESFRVNKIESFGYKSKHDQPCCCLRKDRNFEVLALNYQESPLLRRRAMTSAMPAAVGEQMKCPDKTETLSLNGCSTSRPEHVSIPVVKSPYVAVPLKGSPNGKGKVLTCSDSGCSDSPSGSNSILRLMGKNLMVVNRDEDASQVPLRDVNPNTQTNHVTSQYPTFSSGLSPGNSFHHNQAHGSVILGDDPHNQMEERFDGMAHSMSFRSYMNPKIPQNVAREPPSLFPKLHPNGGFFTSSMELPQEYKGDHHFQIPLHNKPAGKPIAASTFRKNACSASSANKEIIVIDDCEADHLVPAASSYTQSGRPNVPLYQSLEQPSLLCGSPVFYNTAGFHTIPSRLVYTSPVSWDGSAGVLQRGPFNATATPSGGLHTRSALYNPPSLLK